MCPQTGKDLRVNTEPRLIVEAREELRKELFSWDTCG